MDWLFRGKPVKPLSSLHEHRQLAIVVRVNVSLVSDDIANEDVFVFLLSKINLAITDSTENIFEATALAQPQVYFTRGDERKPFSVAVFTSRHGNLHRR